MARPGYRLVGDPTTEKEKTDGRFDQVDDRNRTDDRDRFVQGMPGERNRADERFGSGQPQSTFLRTALYEEGSLPDFL